MPNVLSSLRAVLSRQSEPRAEILSETKIISLKALESFTQSDKVAKRFYNLKLHEGLKDLDLKSKEDLVAKIIDRVEAVKGLPFAEVDSLPLTEVKEKGSEKAEKDETDAEEYTPMVEPADHEDEKS